MLHHMFSVGLDEIGSLILSSQIIINYYVKKKGFRI
jgi:hypothetical protein